MKNIEYTLDWPTFCGVEDGDITIIPYFGNNKDISKGDTLTCSHLDRKIVKKIKNIVLKDIKDLSDIEIKKMGFKSFDNFLSYYTEISNFSLVRIITFYENNYYLNTTTSCYNPEYDEKPWRKYYG